MTLNQTCPVCGYTDLDFAPYDDYGIPSQEICPCCGTQFGYDDANTSHDDLRNRWIQNGAIWHSSSQTPPQGWNAERQISALKEK